MGRLPKILVVSMALCLFTAGALAAPVISDVEVSRLYGTSATVTWTTNTASTSRVYYGTSTPPASYVSSSELVTSHSITLTGLSTCTTYYFSVMSTDGGGSTTDNNGGAYYTFATGLDTQPDYDSTDVPKTIPMNGSVTSTLTVSDNKTIEDINVTIGSVLQTNVYTLSLCLIAPDDTCIPLSLYNGDPEEEDYYMTVFDDQAELYVGDTAQSPPYTGYFKPNGQLGHLAGKNAAGTWTLVAENYDNTEDGSLEAWGLSFSYPYKHCASHLSVTEYTVLNDVCTGMGSGGNDGVVDPGEEITLRVTLYNDGNANQTGITGTLTTSTAGVTVNDGSASFPDTAMENSGSSLSNHFKFTVSDITLECATEIEFTLHIASSQKPTGWNETFIVPIGNQTSPGGTVLDEDFTFGIPATWTIVNGGTGGEGPPDASTWTSSNPCLAPNDPPLNAPVAQVDSFCAGEEATQDEQLITPVLNLSAADEVTLDFDEGFFYWYDNSTYEIGDVDIKSSLTSGSWVNILRNDYTTCYYGCIGSPSLDITDYAAGASNVQIRFHYYAAAYDNAWVIDNVRVTYTIDPQCSMNRCCPDMTEPVIGTISDLDLCDQDGISIPFTQGSPATRHDLYVDGVLEVSGVTSPVSYDPGDENSHSYVIRAVNYYEDCYVNSPSKNFTDQDQTPSKPSITNITDDDACAQSGIKVYYTAGSPATSTKLVVDSVEVATMTGSPYSYNPGNTASHTYIVRTYNNTCHNDSTSQAFSDANVKPGAPMIGTITDSSGACAYGISIPFTAGSGATSHDLYVNGSLAQSGVTSPASYTPASTSSHTYVVRAKYGTCYTDSDGKAFSDTNDKPGAPTIGTIGDTSGNCALGISIPFASGAGATSHDLYVDSVLALSGVTSPVSYTPANTSSHTYVIRAIKGTCSTDSLGKTFSDINTKPGQPVIGTIGDTSGNCAYGISIPFASGAGATSHNLYVDSVLKQTGVTSPVAYTPADTNSHTYVIRAINGSCSTDSDGKAFSDINTKPGEPVIGTITDSSGACAYGISIPFAEGSGAESHSLYVDGSLVQSGVSSPVSYTPASNSSRSYVIRAISGSCSTDSPAKVFSDTNDKPGAPLVTAVNDVSACAQSGIQVVFTDGLGAASHDLYSDGTSVVTGYLSGVTYVPGDTASHSYVVRAVNGTCWTDSNALSGSDADGTPGAPAISSVLDVNGCALSGVTVTFTTGTPATQHDLYVDGSLAQANITSPYVYSPGDTSSHDYVVRAVNGTCHTDSNTLSCSDVNAAPSAPSISSVTDIAPCAQTGVTVTFTAGTPATQHDLYVDGGLAQANVTSPYVHNPGDTSGHSYVVKAVNGACTADSNAVNATDANGTPSQPSITSIVDNDPTALTGIKVYYNPGSPSTWHNLLKDGSTVKVNYVSGDTYSPGDSNNHSYQIRAINGTCYTTSLIVVAKDAICVDPGMPSITGITDVSPCATSGIQITYTAGSGALSHDLYDNGSLAVTNYASGAVYSPGDNSSHSYVIRAVDGSCFTDSPPQAGTDLNGTPGAPLVTAVNDVSACAQSGIQVVFTDGSGAASHDLYSDGTSVVTGYLSGVTYVPGDTASHSYVVRAVNGTCWTDSNALSGSDADGTPSAPAISSVLDVNGCALSGVTVTYTTGSPATQHDLYVDGSLAQANITSPYVYSPGDTSSHDYVVRAVNGTCHTDSNTLSCSDVNTAPSAPSISSVTDIAPCALTGVTVTFTAGTPATQHDLYVDGGLAQANVSSPFVYNPGNTSNHSFVIKAVNGACTADSNAVNATDANGTPSQPSITSIVDNDPTALTGIKVYYNPGSPSTWHNLMKDGSTVKVNYVSGDTYSPGDSNNHSYQIRAINGTCYTTSPIVVSKDAVCTNPGSPSITGITDVSPCATSGIQITYTAGSGALSHDLYDNGSLAVTGYGSGAVYSPGDNSSHSYVIRAVNGACYTDSPSQAGTDANGTPSAPGLSSVVDNNPTVCDGVVVTFAPGSPATQTDLWRDGSQVATNITSPYLHDPGDSASHSYAVRTYNGACYADSGSLAAADLCVACTAPSDPVVETVNTDKTGFKWADIAGADYYRVVRALNADLSTYSFGCIGSRGFGISTGATGFVFDATEDDSQGVAGRCFYYIVQGYDCEDPDEYLGPAGDGVVTRNLPVTNCGGD